MNFELFKLDTIVINKIIDWGKENKTVAICLGGLSLGVLGIYSYNTYKKTKQENHRLKQEDLKLYQNEKMLKLAEEACKRGKNIDFSINQNSLRTS